MWFSPLLSEETAVAVVIDLYLGKDDDKVLCK